MTCPKEYDCDRVIRELAGGMQGVVVLAKDKKSGRKVAIKKYDLESVRKREDFSEAVVLVLGEATLMRQLRHPNILPLISSFYHENGPCLVTPFAHFGSLRDILDNAYPSGIPEPKIWPLLLGVLSALDHLHSQGIVHRSVRASHILLSENGRIMLAGFRYACFLSPPDRTGTIFRDRYDYSDHLAITNLNWLSPEILAQRMYKYDGKSDVYSLGATACELANGYIPFADMNNTFILLEKLRGVPPRLLDRSTLELNGYANSETRCSEKEKPYTEKELSEDLHSLVEDCTQLNPENRPSPKVLLGRSLFRRLKKSEATASFPSGRTSRTFKGGKSLSSIHKKNDSDFITSKENEGWIF